MKPVRGIETSLRAFLLALYSGTFKLMKPVRGIETYHLMNRYRGFMTFKLMKPVRGIETNTMNQQ